MSLLYGGVTLELMPAMAPSPTLIDLELTTLVTWSLTLVGVCALRLSVVLAWMSVAVPAAVSLRFGVTDSVKSDSTVVV